MVANVLLDVGVEEGLGLHREHGAGSLVKLRLGVCVIPGVLLRLGPFLCDYLVLILLAAGSPRRLFLIKELGGRLRPFTFDSLLKINEKESALGNRRCVLTLFLERRELA